MAASSYDQIIQKIFNDHYKGGHKPFRFKREDIETAANALKVSKPKNLGDVIYSFRFRRPLPEKIINTARANTEWVIEGCGDAKYEFKLVNKSRIQPNPALIEIKIPDATPQIIGQYALTDEQALLAKIRYNRLIDIFLGLTAYSLQNHLRTKIQEIGQIEIDEVYVGINTNGQQFIIPVQAKGGKDQLGYVQLQQDLTWCKESMSQLAPRAVAAQFMEDGVISMFEVTIHDKAGMSSVKVVQEKHYKLVQKDQISQEELSLYANINS